MKAIAIAVLAVTAAPAVLAQNNPTAVSPEEQSRLERVSRLRAEQEWFQLEQMWIQMREEMRQQIREEIREGVPPEQIQTEIQQQEQLQQQDSVPLPVYILVPESAGPVQTVFITPMDPEHHERERHERERMERYRVEWERIRTQRMREMKPEVASRIVAGIAKAKSPTTAPVVQRTTAPTVKPPPSAPKPSPSPPKPSPSAPKPPATPPPAPKPPPKVPSKGTLSTGN